jgi:excisionase family DNA binding protein
MIVDHLYMVMSTIASTDTLETEKRARDRSDASPGFATPTEASRFLRLSKAMVHKLIGEGKIPACRFGRAVRIPWCWVTEQALGAKE